MTDQEKELRAALLEKGFTAPKSWKAPRLQKELKTLSETKTEQTDSEQAVPADEKSSEITDSTDEQTEPQETEQIDLDEKSSETTELTGARKPADNVDDEALDTEELDDSVLVKAKTAFSNPRLGLKGIAIGKEFTVSADDAKFLVTVDRTCEYCNA